MPQVVIKKAPPTKNRLVAVIFAVVVVVVIIGGVLVMKLMPKPTVQTTQESLKSAEDKRFEGDTAGAIVDLKKQLKAARTSDEKLNLNLAIGGAYESDKQYSEALKYYRVAAEIKPGYGTNNAIAQAAAGGGQKDVARDYYNRNIKLIQDGDAPQHAGDLSDIQDSLKELDTP